MSQSFKEAASNNEDKRLNLEGLNYTQIPYLEARPDIIKHWHHTCKTSIVGLRNRDMNTSPDADKDSSLQSPLKNE